ncbi:MAG: hypothetical protein H6917_15560 [Novosphingobium sp.]|nr:hypothetical protein [Novosphingobium sp.]
MIVATLTEGDGNWLGFWHFDTLPRTGEYIILAGDEYEVVAIEHWPQIDGMPLDDSNKAHIRIHVVERDK